MKRYAQSGFTLMELVAVMAVTAVLIGFAIPAMSGLTQRSQLTSATNELSVLFTVARTEAVTRGRASGVCGSTDGFACDGNWSAGAMAWVDADNDGAFNLDREVIRFAAFPNTLTFQVDGDAIEFDARGRRSSTTNTVALSHSACTYDMPLANRLSVGGTGRFEKQAGFCLSQGLEELPNETGPYTGNNR